MGTRHHQALPDQPYFVTAATRDRRPIFRSARAARLMVTQLGQLRNELPFLLLAYVVMPDHIHLIIVPTSGAGLSRIMQSIKGRFARLWNKRNGRQGSLWQSRFYESAVRTEAKLNRWLQYIERNPVEAGLAQSPEEYPYCSSGGKLKTDLEDYLGGFLSRAEARPSEENVGVSRP